ncbi:MAG: cbb3-type cytochrome c oxidase N-terminal domain-containing protein [Phycisphaerales bacterium]
MKPSTESRHGNEILTEEQSILLDHSYDGIEEFDNPTPGWWHLIFFASFVFSLLYVPLYHFGGSMPSVYDNYERSVTAYYETLFADVGDLDRDEASLLEIMHAPEFETFDPVARSVFIAKCAACHGSDASGGTGPNLTDDVYLNIKDLEDIADVIANGANNGVMPAWEGRLHPNQIALLAAYVANLRGKNLPGKAPEGDAPPPWPAYEPVSN